MGMAVNYGIHFTLETPEERARAEQLITLNPDKYEIVLKPAQYHLPERTWFYCCANPDEVDSIAAWVSSGEGEKPDGHLPW